MEPVTIRHILPSDNAAMAAVIRRALEEFQANKPGTVYFDDSTDHLYELFLAEPQSEYFIAERNGELLGGAGIYPTHGLPAHTCELVKMYLSPAARGQGLGWSMISRCMDAARAKGFTHMYLETMPELRKAVSVYEKFGFTYLDAPMGHTGHDGCDIWMIREL